MTQIFICITSDFIRRYERQKEAEGERETMRGWSNSELGKGHIRAGRERGTEEAD